MADPEPPTTARPTGRDLASLPDPDLLRAGIALLLAVLLAVAGAYVLGEYTFTGLAAVGVGALFGLVVGEVVVEVGRRRTIPVALAVAAVATAGMVWAGYRASGEGLEPITGGAWLAAASAAAVALVRTADLSRRRRTTSTPTST